MAIRIQLSFPLFEKPHTNIPRSALFPPPKCRRPFSVSASAMTATPSAANATMYDLLSVPKTARPEEIRSAYRRQARQWHPDVCPSSSDQSFFAEQFIRAREAYEVLSDPDLRQAYDLALAVGSGGGFGDWESQLEGLQRRSDARVAAAATSA